MKFYLLAGKVLFKKWENQIVWSQPFNRLKEQPLPWEREGDLQTGDVVFHCVKGAIIAISHIKREYMLVHESPSDLDKVGYTIGAVEYQLPSPMKIKAIRSAIKPVIALESVVFSGKGVAGHFYSCNEALAMKLLELIYSNDIEVQSKPFTMDLLSPPLEDKFPTLLQSWQTAARQKIERDMKIFSSALLAVSEGKCAFCDVRLPTLLRATYAKPWKDCTAEERLDPDNGLLLCYNHSALYEQGLVTIDSARRIKISSQLAQQHDETFEIMKVNMSEGNKPYFSWHERFVFKG